VSESREQRKGEGERGQARMENPFASIHAASTAEVKKSQVV